MKIKKYKIIIISILLILNALTVITISEESDPTPEWPASWILLEEDPAENGPGDDYRDVSSAYYNTDYNYLYFRLECYGNPNFTENLDSRYKWFIDIDGFHNMEQSGGNVFEAEYLLFVEESEKKGDGIGDIYLLKDLDDDGFVNGDYHDYLTDPGKILDDTIAGYQIDGNCIDLYILLENISNPDNAYFTWATDQGDPNVDSAPQIDRSNIYWNEDLSKADLSITKSGSVDSILREDAFTYTIQVTNHGPHDAYDAVVEDNLPLDIILNNANPAPTSGSFPDYYWDIPYLGAGETYQILLDVTVEPTASGVISNSVTVYNGTRDPLLGNNVDTEETTIIKVADLSLTKTGDVDFAFPGDYIVYTLHVENNGPDEAVNVNLSDTLPAGVTYVPDVDPPTDSSDSTYWWNLTNIPAGETRDILVKVVVDSIPSIVLSNIAEVSSDTLDLDLINNVASEDTSIGSVADLSITKSDSADPVYPTDIYTYTLVVTNNGPDVATNVLVTDVLPEKLSFISATPIPTGNPAVCCNWNFPSINIGESKIITIDVLVNTIEQGTITNNAQVTSDTTDLTLENNEVSEDTFIDYAAELSVIKTSSADTVVAGDNLTYTITVTNNGPNTAESVVLTDVLPYGVTFDEAIPTPSSSSGQTHQWNIGSLDVGESFIIILNVTIDSGVTGTISNQVTVSSDTHDPDEDDNDDTDDTEVIGTADLSVDKTSNVTGPIYAEDAIKYTINITNYGPDTALNVNVTDVLPGGVTFESANPMPTGNNGSKYWWIIPSIDVSESVYIEINVTVNAGFSGVIINIAYVNESTYDPNEENNQDEEETTVDVEYYYPPSGGGGTGGAGDGDGGITTDDLYLDPTAVLDDMYYGAPGEKIEFDGSDSHDNDEDGEIVRYDWKYTDEDEWYYDQGAFTNNTYIEPGVYTVSLRVFDDEGSSDTTTALVNIIKPNSPPSEPLIEGPENGTQNVSYNFTVISTDPDGDDINYVIDWGDGETTESGFSPEGILYTTDHKWLEPGIYDISVTADDGETTTTEEMTIEIYEPEPEETNLFIPLLLLLLFLILMLLAILAKRRKDKKKEESTGSQTSAQKSAKQ